MVHTYVAYSRLYTKSFPDAFVYFASSSTHIFFFYTKNNPTVSTVPPPLKGHIGGIGTVDSDTQSLPRINHTALIWGRTNQNAGVSHPPWLMRSVPLNVKKPTNTKQLKN